MFTKFLWNIQRQKWRHEQKKQQDQRGGQTETCHLVTATAAACCRPLTAHSKNSNVTAALSLE